MLMLTTVVLYGLGAALMRWRLAVLDDVHLSDMPGPSPAFSPVPIALVVLWPVAVLVLTGLAAYLAQEPRRRNRRKRR